MNILYARIIFILNPIAYRLVPLRNCTWVLKPVSISIMNNLPIVSHHVVTWPLKTP